MILVFGWIVVAIICASISGIASYRFIVMPSCDPPQLFCGFFTLVLGVFWYIAASDCMHAAESVWKSTKTIEVLGHRIKYGTPDGAHDDITEGARYE